MKIAMSSDLHLDIWTMYHFENHKKRFENHGGEADVLVLAGDVAEFVNYQEYLGFFQYLSSQYKTIILIAGNHEFYRGNIMIDYDNIHAWLKSNRLNNIKFLNNSTIKIGDVRFFGSTLWTNVDNSNPLIMSKIQYVMNDYRHIQYTMRRLNVEDTIRFHHEAVKYLGSAIKRYRNEDTKKIVVTHHAPSLMSINSKYKNNPNDLDVSFAYCSDLLDIEGKFPSGDLVNLWIHGHVHDHFDYIAPNGKTRVVANPLGYPDERASRFGPMFDDECLLNSGWYLKIVEV